MGFHVESALSHATSHKHGHEHAHTHDFYSLSLGLLLHRFPIGVFIYHKFFTQRASYINGFILVSAMIGATLLGYIEYDRFSQFFGAEKFAHTFEYIVVALLLHFVVAHIYNMIRNRKC